MNEQYSEGRDLQVFCRLLSGESEGNVGEGPDTGIGGGGVRNARAFGQLMSRNPCRHTGMNRASLQQTEDEQFPFNRNISQIT